MYTVHMYIVNTGTHSLIIKICTHCMLDTMLKRSDLWMKYYAHIYTCSDMHTHTHTHTCHLHTNIHIHACTHIHIHAYTHTCTHIYTYIDTHTCTHVYMHTYTLHTHMFTCIHIHIQYTDTIHNSQHNTHIHNVDLYTKVAKPPFV